MRAGEIDLQRL